MNSPMRATPTEKNHIVSHLVKTLSLDSEDGKSPVLPDLSGTKPLSNTADLTKALPAELAKLELNPATESTDGKPVLPDLAKPYSDEPTMPLAEPTTSSRASLRSSCPSPVVPIENLQIIEESCPSEPTTSSTASLRSRSSCPPPVALVTEYNCLRRLECAAQQYAWGRIGSSAMVARMKKSQSAEFTIDEEAPYAELWIGTHPNGMSEIVTAEGNLPLLDYVREDPVQHCGVKDKDDLSFLFKVLSIRKVLSIQAHPDKELAEKLHRERPEVYKDPNHKPEMAVALSDDFEAMSGFQSVEEIAKHVEEYPEFAALINDEAKARLVQGTDSAYNILKGVFRSYMEAEDEVVQLELKNMLARLNSKAEPSDCDKLILRLADQFPGDCGIFAPLLLNHLKLTKGEAFYIGANEPHAYIQGEILECMACSDNVVRAGLTPKLKDVETLVDMLTYETSKPEITRGEMVDGVRLYKPEVEDFCMEIVDVLPGQRFEFCHVSSPSVILTLEGSGQLEQPVQSLDMNFGKTAFMSADTRATAVAGADGLRLVRARSNVPY